MASIQKRGSTWFVRVRRRGLPVQCGSFDRKTDAEAWARQVENEIDRGVFISQREAESTTLHEALGRYIKEYVEPRSLDVVRDSNRVRSLQRRPFTQKMLAAVRSRDIADFIRTREAEGAKPNTIRLDLAILSRLFSFAVKGWGMEGLTNPVQHVEKPKLPPGRTRRLEGDEEQRLLDAAPDNLRTVIRWALETAMRREEIATLAWGQIDLKRRTAHLPYTKNGEARTVPLSPAALQILSIMPRQISGDVFGMSPNAITSGMRRTCKRAGVKGLTFHDLRHEAISRLFENTDLDAMEIKSISGHKTLQMLVRYSHLRAHRLADRLAGAKRGEVWNGETPAPQETEPPKTRRGRPRKVVQLGEGS